MAATYVGTSNAQWGVASTETGIFVDSVSETGVDPYEFLRDENGQRTGFAYNVDPEQQIQVSGEHQTTPATGLAAASFGSTVSVSNQTASFFGITAGNTYLTSVTKTQNRSGWLSYNFSFSRYPEV